jgi:hypothetical protein
MAEVLHALAQLSEEMSWAMTYGWGSDLQGRDPVGAAVANEDRERVRQAKRETDAWLRNVARSIWQAERTLRSSFRTEHDIRPNDQPQQATRVDLEQARDARDRRRAKGYL